MNSIVLENINDLFDSYDLFSSSGKKNIRSKVLTRFPDISDKEIKEAEDYLHSFYEYCLKYADMLADKYKTPFLPKEEDAQKEISEYVSECRKQYPEIDAKQIEGIFSAVCWLANR